MNEKRPQQTQNRVKKPSADPQTMRGQRPAAARDPAARQGSAPVKNRLAGASPKAAPKALKKPPKSSAKRAIKKAPQQRSASADKRRPASGNTPAAPKRPAPPMEKRSASPTAELRSAAAKKPSDAVRQRRRVRGSTAKRHKYRGGNYILYYMLAGAVIITVLAILANTVLFKCNTIVVSGNLRYSAEEIVKQSGIKPGQNLLHINARKAEENIVAGLPYADSAEVKKNFPSGLSITVTEAEKWFCIKEGGMTAAISYAGKIVEQGSAGDLPVVIGYEPQSIEVGTWLSSETEGKTDIPSVILKAVEAASLENVEEIDITDRFSIKMRIDGGRVLMELGTVSDMESKMNVANELIRNRIGSSENVTILLSNPLQPTVRPIDVVPGASGENTGDDPGENADSVVSSNSSQ